MDASTSSTPVVVKKRLYLWLGIELLAAGLAGHIFAARAIGGSYIAYRDHLFGFAILTVVTGALLAVAARKFWPGRHDITLLILGALQAVIGVYVYIERFSVHG